MSRDNRVFRVGVVLLVVFAFALAGRGLDSPGLYYDEAVQARPALEFASGHVHAQPLPGSQSVWLGARRFPVMTQPYMGALKSQALIPSFWLAGAEVEVLRLTTLSWALAGLVFVAAFVRRAFGLATALTTTALLCCDPSFLLLARHDWGSFSLSFLLRGIALWCGWSWWESRRAGWLWLAAFAAGLAFYNKIDIAIFASAVGAAVLAVAGKPLFAALREQRRAGATAAGAAVAFTLGLAPMIPALGAVVGARNAFAQPNEMAEKLQTLFSMADGSHFHRLMETGGMFGAESLAQVANAPGSSLPFVLLPAVAWLAFRAALAWFAFRAGAAGGVYDPRGLFLLIATALSILGVIALPGGVRIHHAMNVYPLLHLLLAYALVDVVRAGAEGQRGARPRIILAASVAIGAIVISTQWLTFERTLADFQQTGGKGRWSRAIHELASELDESSQATVSSLDWGFHEPLAFLARGGNFREAHWQIPQAVRQRGSWVIAGKPGDLYVLHLPPYDRSGFGQPFLEAAESLKSRRVAVRRYRDGEGELAFMTVRVNAPHRIRFAGTASGRGAFRIELDP